jgi:hypothetical protein
MAFAQQQRLRQLSVEMVDHEPGICNRDGLAGWQSHGGANLNIMELAAMN